MSHVVTFQILAGPVDLAAPIGKGADSYTILGNTLAPGFEYADFEMGYRDELQRSYPQHAKAIARLTREGFATRSPKPPGQKVSEPLPTLSTTDALAFAVNQVKRTAAAQGLAIAEIVGRTASAPSERCSIAFFTLEAGSRTPTSINRTAEEHFIVTAGSGVAWVGERQIAIEPGVLVVAPPQVPHSLRANPSDDLHFYAVSSPAFLPEDFVVVPNHQSLPPSPSLR